MREGRAPKGAEHSLAAQARAWSTPLASMAGGDQRLNYEAAGKPWPTPAARDWKDSGPTQGERKSPNLGTMVHHEWPTPAATPYGTSNNGCPGDGREAYATKGKPSLEGLARGRLHPARHSTTGKNRARLNHRWVAQLMGFPATWLDVFLATAATA